MIYVVDFKLDSSCFALKLFFSIRIISPVPCAVSTMMLYLLKLM